MGKIFKNLIPYWKSVIVIFILLVFQAYCDLYYQWRRRAYYAKGDHQRNL
mgnify:CR=1 FL=1